MPHHRVGVERASVNQSIETTLHGKLTRAIQKSLKSRRALSRPRVRDGAPTVEGVFRRVNQLNRHPDSRGLLSSPLVTRCS
ncbi:MAG: hypothetical protein ABI980_11930 [Nitrospirota bacterium]